MYCSTSLHVSVCNLPNPISLSGLGLRSWPLHFLSAHSMVSCHRPSTPLPFNSPLRRLALKPLQVSFLSAGGGTLPQSDSSQVHKRTFSVPFLQLLRRPGSCALVRKPQAFSSCTVMSHTRALCGISRATRRENDAAARESVLPSCKPCCWGF